MAEDLRVGFHRELDEIDQKVVQLFALVSEGLSAATDAFLAGDREAAKQLMDRDKVIDSLYIDVEDHPGPSYGVTVGGPKLWEGAEGARQASVQYDVDFDRFIRMFVDRVTRK